MKNQKLYSELASEASQTAKTLSAADPNMFETYFVQSLVELTAAKCIEICESGGNNDNICYTIQNIQITFGLE